MGSLVINSCCIKPQSEGDCMDGAGAVSIGIHIRNPLRNPIRELLREIIQTHVALSVRIAKSLHSAVRVEQFVIIVSAMKARAFFAT